jgi:hypothetical protein
VKEGRGFTKARSGNGNLPGPNAGISPRPARPLCPTEALMEPVHASSSGTLRFPRRLFSALLSTLLVLPPLTVASGQTPSDRVYEFLESASGFFLLGTLHEGALESGRSMAITVPLLEGAEYMVVAYCDDRCVNLDLILFDSSGEEILADRLPDREPILALTAESTGEYFIQAEAVECLEAGCEVAVGILGSTDEPGVGPGEDMGSRLILASAELTSAGFAQIEGDRRGALGTDKTVDLPVMLQQGSEYRIIGVCDRDCLDFDLALFDPAGVEVASDYWEDALPILVHRPDTTGEYRVEVIMVACQVEPCAYRIATYVKEGNAEPGGAPFSGALISHETYDGLLDSNDQELSGAYLDVYEVEARVGERIIVDLRSEAFDTLLRVLDPDGTGEENDDYGYDTGHSHIEMLALKTGVYSVQVTSYSPGETGEYVLQIAVVG